MTPLLKLTHAFFLLAVLIGRDAFTQSKDLPSQEAGFVKTYSNLLKKVPGDNDSIASYSDRFSTEFTSFIKTAPATLAYPFNKLIASNVCRIQTARDGKFRIYSWDTREGGSLHFFRELYQWESNGNVFAKLLPSSAGEAGNFCSKIFTAAVNDKTYYLAVTNGIYSTKDASQSIAVFTVEGNKLTDTVRLFKTATKRLNRIDVSFDFFSVVDRPERPLELITYNEARKIIYIPVVNGNGRVTARNILYQLKGGCFEFTGIETGKRK